VGRRRRGHCPGASEPVKSFNVPITEVSGPRFANFNPTSTAAGTRGRDGGEGEGGSCID
jgi:hypothetical protein